MSINVLVASGNIGRDMEVRYTPNGKAIGSFSLPVKSGWGDNEKVSWVTVIVLGEKSEKLKQYLTKGRKVTVTGELVVEEWESEGVKRSKVTLVSRDIDFTSQSQGASQQQNFQPQQQQGFNPQQQQQQFNQSASMNPSHQAPVSEVPFSDDIPF